MRPHFLFLFLFLSSPLYAMLGVMDGVQLKENLDLREQMMKQQAIRDDEMLIRATGASSYIWGAAEMGNKTYFCFPAKWVISDVVEVVHRFLKANPQRLNEPAALLVRAGLAKKFPCL